MEKEMKSMWGKRLLECMGSKLHVFLLAMILAVPSVSFAARPLVTDDAGTVGKKKVQLEMGVEASFWKDTEDGVETKDKETEASAVLTYGLTDTIDLVASVPYTWHKIEEDGATIFDQNGISDVSFEVKWRFFEKDGLGLALKPGIFLPTGDHEEGFGSGRVNCGITFIATKEFDPFALHFNASYRRNENKVDERRDLYAASLAATYKVIKGLNLVGNVGFERNADPEKDTMPAFALVGLNYAITDFLMVDAGVKFGLNKQEADHAFIGGLTLNF